MKTNKELSSMRSFQCGICNVIARSYDGMTAHSQRTTHIPWNFAIITLRGIVCNECGHLCGSERLADKHAKEQRHLEFRVEKPEPKKKDKSKGKGIGTSASNAGLQEVLPQAMTDLIATLEEMGYLKDDAVKAIETCGTDNINDILNILGKNVPGIDTEPEEVVFPEWSNMVTNEMKIFSEKLRNDAMEQKNGTPRSVSEPNSLDKKRLMKFVTSLPDEEQAILKEKYIIAEDLEDDEVLKAIDQALSESDPSNGIYKFSLPKIPGENAYSYDQTLKQMCLVNNGSFTCSTSTKKHRAKATRIGILLALIKKWIQEKEAVRLRWIYYFNSKVFKNQTLVDDTVAAVSLLLKATRSSLHIRPSPRGSIIGPVMLCTDDVVVVNGTLGAVSGSSIPSEADCINQIILVSEVRFILIVEKETVFFKLSDTNFWKKHRCVIVTAFGEPDVATRVVLFKLRQWLDVPIFGLFDANVHGFEILCTYKFGSKNRAYDNLSLTVPDLIWMGLILVRLQRKMKFH